MFEKLFDLIIPVTGGVFCIIYSFVLAKKMKIKLICMTLSIFLLCFSCKKEETNNVTVEQKAKTEPTIQPTLNVDSIENIVEQETDLNTDWQKIAATGYVSFVGYINDENVRLRDKYGLDSNILRKLNIGERTECVEYVELKDDSDFKWIQIKTNIDSGWVYGEYIFQDDISNFSFKSAENLGIKTKDGIIYSGMKETDLRSVLGDPESTFYDEEYNDDSFYYNGLTILVNRNLKRIHHIIIKSSEYELVNGVKIGDYIDNVTDLYSYKKESKETNRYGFETSNLFRISAFDSNAVLITDKDDVIIEIQIGFPNP